MKSLPAPPLEDREREQIYREAIADAQAALTEIKSKDPGALLGLAKANIAMHFLRIGGEWREKAFNLIEERLEALEQRGTLADAWRGVWQPGEVYERGQLATDSGSLWLCLNATDERPSKSPTSWRLIAKGGGR